MLHFREVAEEISALTPFTKSSITLAGIKLVSTNVKNPPKRKAFLVGYPYLGEHNLLSCGSVTRKGQQRVSCNIAIAGTVSMKHFREQPEDVNVRF
jgi:hypothetical protein